MLLVADRPFLRRAYWPFGTSATLHFVVILSIAGTFGADQSKSASGRESKAASGAGGPQGPPLHVHVLSKPTARPLPEPDDLGIELPPGTPRVSLPGFTVDFGKVISHASVLFPFLAPGLFDDLADEERAGNAGPLPNPLRHRAKHASETPLLMTDAQIQAVADGTWSRRDRWRTFQHIVSLARQHNAQEGRLPDVFRAYVDQNLLQVFVDGSFRDPRVWAQLSVAADHRDFIEFIREYAAQHPWTKGRTELLFLLDKLAQASEQALLTVLETNPTEHLQHTRTVNADAYRAVVKIRQHYIAQLDGLGLTSREAIRQHFDAIRVVILNNIVRTTPARYRTADAQYLIAGIRWRQGDRVDALRVWRAIEGEPSDTYRPPYSAIQSALRVHAPERVTRDAINRILDREHGEWVMASADRLRRFGYHVDTF